MKSKLSKAEVNYSPGKRMDRCFLCEHFRGGKTAMGTCELVEGPIKPDYWCEKFKRA